jgi:hypothetical protein
MSAHHIQKYLAKNHRTKLSDASTRSPPPPSRPVATTEFTRHSRVIDRLETVSIAWSM